MTGTITVVVADDHPLFRKGVADTLRSDPSVSVVGEAADGRQALELIARLAPQVAVLDLEMPEKTGLEVAAEVRGTAGAPKLVLLTMHVAPDILQRALSLGVRGYVSKESAADDVLACIHLVASGRTFVSASLGAAAASVVEPGSLPVLASLTPAERAVLKLVHANRTTRDIATTLGISPKTVEHHRSNICTKLGVTGNNALVRFALAHGQAIRDL